MRTGDISKQAGDRRSLKAGVEGLTRESREVRQGEAAVKSGAAIVQRASAFGRGCVCDIEVVTGGRGSGVIHNNAICHDAQLDAGSLCQYVQNADGTVDLFSSGGTVSDATGTVYNLYTVGGADIP
jgi:hypothetical protein